MRQRCIDSLLKASLMSVTSLALHSRSATALARGLKIAEDEEKMIRSVKICHMMCQGSQCADKEFMKASHELHSTRVWVSGWWRPRTLPTNRPLHQSQASSALQFLFSQKKKKSNICWDQAAKAASRESKTSTEPEWLMTVNVWLKLQYFPSVHSTGLHVFAQRWQTSLWHFISALKSQYS